MAVYAYQVENEIPTDNRAAADRVSSSAAAASVSGKQIRAWKIEDNIYKDRLPTCFYLCRLSHSSPCCCPLG